MDIICIFIHVGQLIVGSLTKLYLQAAPLFACKYDTVQQGQ